MVNESTGRAPTARLSDCATELSEKWGLNVIVNPSCETKFIVKIDHDGEYEALSSIVFDAAARYNLSVLEGDLGISVSVNRF